VTGVIKESVWFIIVQAIVSSVGSVKFLQILFVIFVGEDSTVFAFIREECEKNVENHWSSPFLDFCFNVDKG